MNHPSFTPFKAAATLTHWLDAAAGAGHFERFPVDIDGLAAAVGQQLGWPDKIVEIERANIPGFEGGLFYIEERAGWVLLYNEDITSEGRIRFTKAHELGHYMLHRSLQTEFRCTEGDMTHWTSDANQEMQADEFAGHLLMPLTYFREGLGDGAVDFNQLGAKSDMFGVSLTAAALRWVKSTPSSAVFVLSRDGFMDWAVPSERALKNGAYFKTKSNVCEIPAASVTASGITQKTPLTLAASTWFPNADRAATLQEMTVVCDNYGSTLTLLCLAPNERVWPPWEQR